MYILNGDVEGTLSLLEVRAEGTVGAARARARRAPPYPASSSGVREETGGGRGRPAPNVRKAKWPGLEGRGPPRAER